MSQARRNVHQLTNTNSDKISVVILAAGLPKRMTSNLVSKLFIEVEKETIYQKYIKAVKRYVNDFEVVVVGGYLSSALYDKLPHNVIYVENNRYDTSNNGLSLKLGVQAATTKNILVLYDSLVVNEHLYKNVDFSQSFVISEKTGLFDKKQPGLIHNGGKLENVSYDIAEKWASVAYFTKHEYNTLKTLLNDITEKTLAFELLNKLIDRKGSFTVYNKDLLIKNIATNKDLR
jgi:choline kinase